MDSIKYKLVEFYILFILIPISLTIPFSIWIKVFISVSGFLYIIYILLRVEKNKFQIAKNLKWKLFFKTTVVKLGVIILVTTTFVYISDKANLFKVVSNKPLMWLVLLFIYSVFSVYPQELIYRTFYFQRYEMLFRNQKICLFINAIVFSLAHLFFKNTLVIILTFLGGLLFAFTFTNTRSTLLVSIEHAIYGCWLFTVGMGDMLGFPS